MTRLSRWGISPYESAVDIERQLAVLIPWVKVVEPFSDAEVVVVHSKVRFSAEQCDMAPGLKLLLTTTSGVDHIDLPTMQSRGVAVCRLPQARAGAVVDATLGMLVWGLRRMGEMQAHAAAGVWARDRLASIAPVALAGSKIGLVGQGVIGAKVAEILTALGVEVFACDPRGVPPGCQEASVDHMLTACDAGSLHCDLNSTTKNLISAGRLSIARRGLVVVNTARGALVDVQAAVGALESGVLSALALDVFPVEPFEAMDKVKAMPGLLLSPHAAGYHTGLAQAVREGVLHAVTAFVSGQTLPYRVV